MDAGRARVMRRNDPRKVRIMLGHKYIFSEVWELNPHIQQRSEGGDVQILYGRDPVTNMRPYHRSKSEDRYTYNLDFRPEVGEIYLSNSEWKAGEIYHPHVIIEPHIKPGASPNKNWGADNWREFIRLAGKEGIPLAHMGPMGTQQWAGVQFMPTGSFRAAAAILARCKAAVLHEGGLSHLAAALDKPGVVIFGGFTPIELTGYSQHRNLGASLDEACGMRKPCKHCQRAMAAISPEFVLQQLKEVLSERAKIV